MLTGFECIDACKMCPTLGRSRTNHHRDGIDRRERKSGKCTHARERNRNEPSGTGHESRGYGCSKCAGRHLRPAPYHAVSVDDGAKVVAIKPERLRLLARVPVSKISSLVAEMSEEQQMTAEVQGQPKVSVYAIMEAGENMAETVEKGGHGSSMDVYRGPISAEGMAVLECTGKSLSKGARCSYYGIATGPRGIVDGSRPPRVVDASQNLMENPFDSERQWHRFQVGGYTTCVDTLLAASMPNVEPSTNQIWNLLVCHHTPRT